MQAGAWLSHEASAALVTASSPWIKALQTLLQGPFDRCVVTDLEMKTVDLFITPPVAPPEMGIVLDAKGHRHRFTRISPMGTEQHNMLGQSGVDKLVKERRLKIFAAPGAPTGAMLLIKGMHPHQQIRCEV